MNNDQLDLHGYDINEATMAIMTFLFQKFEEEEMDEVFIITGKGHILREQTIEILEEERYNWAFDENNEGKIIVYRK